ncbi:hypothetical protein [Allochromatium vinosum]|uniref:hypothetical protein n=1 Tax=Allochromatium vinosum TaxID=1049 RepID=UPI0019078E2F|nr:hypothetical protein [Allochromatium vinosum]MBK1656287.1 hypothetical protein [Allochromatium vinosum]
MNYDIAERLISNWGRGNRNVVLEIYIVGSRGVDRNEARNKKKSDLDLMVFVRSADEQEKWFQDLASIGLDTGILIHPLFIEEPERNAKLSINLYADMFAKGRKIFPEDHV